MSVLYKLAKNFTLPISAVILAASVAGVVVGLGVIGYVASDLNNDVQAGLGPWSLWVLILGVLGLLIGGWYVAEQLYKRRKFQKLLATDKRSDFVGARKELDELARRLPDRYKPRIVEKEAAFRSRR